MSSDGAVAVETASGARSAALRPEHRQRFRRSGSLLPVEPDDAGATAAWANGQLVMRSLPLGTVLAERSRDHSARITLAGTGLEKCAISGIVPINDLPNALETIATALQARLTRPGPGSFVLEASSKPGSHAKPAP